MEANSSKKYILISGIGIVVLAVILIFGGSNTSENASIAKPQTASVGTNLSETNGGLKIEDLVLGTGREAEYGTAVTVHYTGWLTDGTKFDSSLDRGTPFHFPLGFGQVIQGWDQGVKGMKVGGKRKLTIPPSLGYGNQTVASIPANSTLVFEVELLKVEGEKETPVQE